MSPLDQFVLGVGFLVSAYWIDKLVVRVKSLEKWQAEVKRNEQRLVEAARKRGE